VIAVVATPREAFWAFGLHAMMLLGVTAAARVPVRFVLRRLLIEVPFVLFAVFLPFVGSGDRVPVLGLSLSQTGLWAAWNIIAKATLGAWASILLAATTQVPDLLKAFTRLRFPRVIVSIMSFMMRYLDLVIGEWNRMRIALRSRGYRPRSIGQAGALAAASGALFVRSYERGERVYLAMLSRGYSGSVPDLTESQPIGWQWATAMVLLAAAATVAAMGWVTR
jgi:cobalt/nickel transport system permease protein